MERDEDRRPGCGPDAAGAGWGDDRAPYDYWDGRLTNEDFVDRPRHEESGDDTPRPTSHTPARPLYDGRPVRDPYDRGGGYRRVSEAVWERARKEYLEGDSCPTVCARHGMAESTFRQRARDERWRRIDQPDPEPVDLEAEEAAGLLDYAEMARHALVRLNRAVLRGRVAEAGGWMRLHARLLDLARAADATSPAPKLAPKPTKTPDPQAAAMAKARTVQTLVRAVADLDPSDETGRRLIDKSLEVLDALERASVSDDSHYSDGGFPDAGSETPSAPHGPP